MDTEAFVANSMLKVTKKRLFLTYRDAKMAILTIKYGHETTKRSMVDGPNDTVMVRNSVKIPQTSGICI